MLTTAATEIHRYWEEVRGNRDVPLRSQIEPGHVRHVLADLFILEAGLRNDIRFRLAGTRICALFSRELRGSSFDSLWAATDTHRLADLARTVMSDRNPVLLSASGSPSFGDRLDVEVIMLPLKSGDGPVDRIIGSLAPVTKPAWIGAHCLPFLKLDGATRVNGESRRLQDGKSHAAEARPPFSPRENPFSQAVRRVLHLSVMDGGRRD